MRHLDHSGSLGAMSAPDQTTFPARKWAIVGGVLTLGLALFVDRRNAMRGFPDGALTDLERCVDPAFSQMPVILCLAALSLFVGAIWQRHAFPAALMAVGLALGSVLRLAWLWNMTCRALENGWGG